MERWQHEIGAVWGSSFLDSHPVRSSPHLRVSVRNRARETQQGCELMVLAKSQSRKVVERWQHEIGAVLGTS